jgi:uncharacterized protein (DUF924 family)
MLLVVTQPTMFTRSSSRTVTGSLLLLSTGIQQRAVSSFSLDRSIFKPALYKKVVDVWLAGISTDGGTVDMDVARRWFMGTPEERVAFDGICRDNFGDALEAIGPAKFPKPDAEPFLSELREIARRDASKDGSEAAWTALSIAILLDQMPRNIFRTDEGLVKVYSHYDHISQSFARALFSPASPIPRPDQHPQLRNSTAHRLWFYMPLCHSEDIAAHEQLDEILTDFHADLEKQHGLAGSKHFLQQQFKAEQEHREILDRFGRYPHRNGAMGRQSTEEEEKFLASGGATFGVVQSKKTIDE